MRRLGEVDLMQPNVIWRRGRRIGLKQRDRNTLRKMPLIGKKNHRDVTANFCLRGYKYFHPDARRITAGDGKGRLCGLICHQQSTCTKNQISKRQVPRLLGLKFWKPPPQSALMIDDICTGAQLGEKPVSQARDPCRAQIICNLSA